VTATTLIDNEGTERTHHGSSGLTATAISLPEDKFQVWYECEFESREEAIFMLGGLLYRVLELTNDNALIAEAVTLCGMKMLERVKQQKARAALTAPTEIKEEPHHGTDHPK
jgi:hypothetical protein